VTLLLAEFPPPESLDIQRVIAESSISSGAVRVEAQARYESLKSGQREASGDAEEP